MSSSHLLTTNEARLMADVLDTHRHEVQNVVQGVLRGVDPNHLGSAVQVQLQLQQAGLAVGYFLTGISSEIAAFAKANMEKFGVVALLSVLGLLSGPIASAIASAVGFTASGVAAGSLAAAWQASIGSVASGSFFAMLQSITATGAIITIGTGVGVAIAIVAIVGVLATHAEDRDRMIQHIMQFGNHVGKTIGGAAAAAVKDVGNFVAAHEDTIAEVRRVGDHIGNVVGVAAGAAVHDVGNAVNYHVVNFNRWMGW